MQNKSINSPKLKRKKTKQNKIELPHVCGVKKWRLELVSLKLIELQQWLIFMLIEWFSINWRIHFLMSPSQLLG